MKIIPLTKSKQALVDDEDYECVAAHRWYYHSQGYAASGWKVNGKTIHVLLHRFVLQASEQDYVDHRNGDRLDCQKSNLRTCTQSQNMQNLRAFRSGSSQFKGVSWYRRDGRWRAYIKVNGKERHLGYFADELAAARAYDRAAAEHFGEFACLNFPSGQYFRQAD
jgi:hypothetical protein